MDVILHQLGQLLLRAVPTFLLVVVLHFYLKIMFFKPLGKVLQQRYESTEGARKLAEESLQRASQKTAEYEAALRTARAEVYQAQEQIHKQLQERETADMAEARKRAEALIQEARAALALDVAAAKATLAADSEALANQIAEAILRRSAA
ncbi:H+-transporting two-sector ATPase, B/B' subunit [Candidatus Sulfopaludibacter sp. SbA3]|nr:H+-transporting two-sector ATPase, B/B' subunit [Candidatus Sulfopaludibacter sp. SbA3]